MAKLNDLIRCEDAIKEICKRTCTLGVFCPDVYCKEVKEWITDDMVVDAVPVRHGRWVQVSQDRANCNRCNCESGKMIRQGERYFPKFCPECGADMRKDGDHHD